MSPILPSRGVSQMSAGSPASRLRVILTCMMLMPFSMAAKSDGASAAWRTSGTVAPAAMRLASNRARSLLLNGLRGPGWVSSADSMSIEARAERISLFRSTAMTISEPSARATETGTGLTRPPSTSHMPLRDTGVNRPGMAMEARTASITRPS